MSLEVTLWQIKDLMKNSFCLILVTVGFLAQMSKAQVIDLKRFTEPVLKEGQCHTLVDSKVYLADMQNPERAKSVSHIIQDLGEEYLSHMSNTSTESYFFCKVKCQLKSNSEYIWIAAKDQNEKMKTDINAFVCPGLSIENVPASQTLSIKTTVPMVFEAVQSNFSEVHFRLKSLSYKLSGPLLSEMIITFFNTLKVVQGAYLSAQAPAFQEAAVEMAQYLPENPESWILIKDKVSSLNERQLDPKKSMLDYTKGSDLVDLFFLFNGRFLQYVD